MGKILRAKRWIFLRLSKKFGEIAQFSVWRTEKKYRVKRRLNTWFIKSQIIFQWLYNIQDITNKRCPIHLVLWRNKNARIGD